MANGLFDYNIVQPQAQQNTTMTPSSMPQMSQGITGMPSAMQMGNLQQGILSQAAQPPTRERGSRILGFLADAFKNPNFVDSLIIGTAGMSTRPNTALQQQVQNRMNTRQQQAALQQQISQQASSVINLARSSGREDLASYVESNPDAAGDVQSILLQQASNVTDANENKDVLMQALSQQIEGGREDLRPLLNNVSAMPADFLNSTEIQNNIFDSISNPALARSNTILQESVLNMFKDDPRGEYFSKILPFMNDEDTSQLMLDFGRNIINPEETITQITLGEYENANPTMMGIYPPGTTFDVKKRGDQIISYTPNEQSSYAVKIDRFRNTRNTLANDLDTLQQSELATAVRRISEYDLVDNPELLNQYREQYDALVRDNQEYLNREKVAQHHPNFGNIPQNVLDQFYSGLGEEMDISLLEERLMPEGLRTEITDNGYVISQGITNWGNIKVIRSAPDAEWLRELNESDNLAQKDEIAFENMNELISLSNTIVSDSSDLLSNIDRGLELMYDPNGITTGYFGGIFSVTERITDGDLADEYDEFDSISKNLILELSEVLKGALSAQENLWLESAAIGLYKDKEANIRILERLRELYVEKVNNSRLLLEEYNRFGTSESNYDTLWDLYYEYSINTQGEIIDTPTNSRPSSRNFAEEFNSAF